MFVPPPYVPTEEEENYHIQLDAFRQANPDAEIIAPQKGPQTRFCLSRANVCIYGGAGGGGKTYGSLICGLGAMQEHPGFDIIMFRQTMQDAKKSGSLVDETRDLYEGAPLGAKWNGQSYRFTFPNKSTVALGGMSQDKQLQAQRGSQYGGVIFDELNLFKKKMFWYMMTRMRSMSGASTFIKATTNPEPEGWVKQLLEEAGYLDKETGFAIYEMSGVLRWFYMGDEDKLIWFDSRQEALAWWKKSYPEEWARYVRGVVYLRDNPGKTLTDAKQAGINCRSLRNPLSFTFIPSTLSDNAKMLEVDPDYEANLENQPLEDRMALLYGCWKNFGNTGLHFKESMCKKLYRNQLPGDLYAWWGADLGYTEKTETNDPDYTCLVLQGWSRSTGKYYIIDSVFVRVASVDLAQHIWDAWNDYLPNGAKHIEGMYTEGICIPQDPAAGKGNVGFLSRDLAGLNVVASPEKGGEVSLTGRKVNPKLTRFLPFASQARNGNVELVYHDNLDQWLNQLVSFPTGKNDDAVDATSRAFSMLVDDDECFFGRTG